MLNSDLQSFFIALLGKPEEKEKTETPKTSDNLMSIQNSPSDMFVKTVESPENQGAQSLFQHFRGLLKEKILLKFLPKSEGAIASYPTPLAPTTLLIDKENTNNLDITVDPCQKEDETLLKKDSVTVTIHASADEEIVAKKFVKIQADKEETEKLIENADDADDLTKALPIEENTNDLGKGQIISEQN